MDLFSILAEATRPVDMAQFMAIPAQPEERKPAAILFTSIPQVFEEIRKIGHADKLPYCQFIALQQAVNEQSPAILAMINKMTMAEINKYIYKRSSSDTKKEMVENLYDCIVESFNISGNMISYSPFGGSGPQTYAEALKLQLAKQTQQDYINYCTEKQAASNQRKKAIENPETLEEFRVFLTYRKPETMTQAQEIKELERKFIGAQIGGFFPTPKTLAAKVVELANIQPGNTILEPSAGLGHIADAISEAHPENYLLCVEQNNSLYQALCMKGYRSHNSDFLSHPHEDTYETYDRIIMNPPFENGQDITHVLHAYSLLNTGGRLVAIMAGNKGKQNQQTREFMQFIENAGGSIEDNPPGSFLSAFRPTGVSTVTVILDK